MLVAHIAGSSDVALSSQFWRRGRTILADVVMSVSTPEPISSGALNMGRYSSNQGPQSFTTHHMLVNLIDQHQIHVYVPAHQEPTRTIEHMRRGTSTRVTVAKRSDGSVGAK